MSKIEFVTGYNGDDLKRPNLVLFANVPSGARFTRPTMPSSMREFIYQKISMPIRIAGYQLEVVPNTSAINTQTGVVVEVEPAELVRLDDPLGEIARRKQAMERNAIRFGTLGDGEAFRLVRGHCTMIKIGTYSQAGARGVYLHSGNYTSPMGPDVLVVRRKVKMEVEGDVER